jgi:hypothetical protein
MTRRRTRLRALRLRLFGTQEGSDEPVKVNLGWLGALLVVVAICVVVFIRLRTTGDDYFPWELERDSVRAYFASPRGGGAPDRAASRIELESCERFDETHDDPIDRCRIRYETGGWRPCFHFRFGDVVRGPTELPRDSGVDRIRWSNRRRSFVAV